MRPQDRLVFCAECKKDEKRSRVEMTLTWYAQWQESFDQTFYDEDGAYHYHNSSPQKALFSCSNDHRWKENLYADCPTCGDKWRVS